MKGEIRGGGEGEEVESGGGEGGIGGLEVFAELVGGEGEEVGGGRVEREGGAEVGGALESGRGGGEELEGVEGGPGHVDEVVGGEVCELLDGEALGVGIGGADLAADLGEEAVDEGGFAAGGGAEGFDHVIERALEEGLH